MPLSCRSLAGALHPQCSCAQASATPSHLPPEHRQLSSCFSSEDFNLLPGLGVFPGTQNLSPLPMTLGNPLEGKDQRVVAPRQLVEGLLRMLCFRSIADHVMDSRAMYRDS